MRPSGTRYMSLQILEASAQNHTRLLFLALIDVAQKSMLPCCSEEHVALFFLFIDNLEILVDDCDRQQDTSAATDGPQEVRHNRQHTDAHASKGSSCRDVHVEHVQ